MLAGVFSRKLIARQYSAMLTSTTAAAKDFLSFVNASPTPFHAVKWVKERLGKAGFQEIKVSSPINKLCKWMANSLVDRRKSLGHQAAFPVGSTTSLEMDRPSSLLQLGRDGSLVTLSP